MLPLALLWLSSVLSFTRLATGQAAATAQHQSGAPTFVILARLEGIQQAVELAACAKGNVPGDLVHLQEARVDDLLQCDRQVIIAGI